MHSIIVACHHCTLWLLPFDLETVLYRRKSDYGISCKDIHFNATFTKKKCDWSKSKRTRTQTAHSSSPRIYTLPPTMTCRTSTTKHKTATANTLLIKKNPNLNCTLLFSSRIYTNDSITFLTTIYTRPQNQSQLTNQRTQYIQFTFNTINQINNVQFIHTLPPTMTCRTGTTKHKTAIANTLLFPPPSPFPSQKMRVRVTRRKTFYYPD